MDPYAAAAGFPEPRQAPRMPAPAARAPELAPAGGTFLQMPGSMQDAILADVKKTGAGSFTVNGQAPDAARPAAPAAVDPYAAAAGFGGGAPASAPTATPAAPAAPGGVDDAIRGAAAASPYVAGGEAALSMGTGMLSSAAGGLAGLAGTVLPGPEGQGANWSDAIREAGTYVPRSAEGRQALELAGKVQEPFTKAGEWAQEGTEGTGAAGSGAMGAIAKAGIENLPALVGLGAKAPARSGAETAMEAAFRRAKGERIEPNFAPNPGVDVRFPTKAVDNSPEALARDGFTVPGKTIADASPELQKAVADAKSAGRPIDPVILGRRVTADTLPVPVKMTEGQATMDPTLISHEMNGRGKSQPAVPPDFYNAQGKALAANVDAIAAKVAPDIADTGKTSLGQTVVDAYKAKDAPIVADISAKYKALADANGGALPIDGAAFVKNTEAALSRALKSGSVPADLAAALNEFRAGRQMTFEDFETLRSDAADAMRSSTDGRARAAAGIIREQLESMPLTAEAAALKPLADSARSAAKARFDALEKDPAYKAAIGDGTPAGEPSPLADRFTDGYVINGRHANVRQMRANLADDATANQAIAAAQVEHLRNLAKADPVTGNFSQAGWNKGVQAAGPKLAEILGDEAQTALALGETAKLVQAQPRGAFVNNSNTATALVAEGAKAAATHSTNMLFGGLPVGSVVRNVGGRLLDSRAAAQASKRAMDPASGLTRLSDVGKK